jgi:hypothetical protein
MMTSDAYAARVKYRGFDEDSATSGTSKYLNTWQRMPKSCTRSHKNEAVSRRICKRNGR